MLETLYKEALDRKKNPKEGSYTNYLFNKGLDKILKTIMSQDFLRFFPSLEVRIWQYNFTTN